MRIYNNANFLTSQAKSLALDNLTSDPSVPVVGQVWLNTTSNQIKIKNNSSVVVISDQYVASVGVTAPITSTGGLTPTIGISAASASAAGSMSSAHFTLLANATSSATASTLVSRDASGNFSAGTITATQFSGSGAGLTSIPNTALTNSSVTIGSTAVALGATVTTLAGLTSVTATTFTGSLSGTATNATNLGVTNDVATATAVYPVWVTANTGNLPHKVSSTKLSFIPSTGVLSATQFAGSGAGLTAIPNTALTNSSVTLGSTAVALGATVASLAGLTSVAATTFTGSLSGNASSATNLANGAAGSIPYQTASGNTTFLAAGTGVLVGGSTPSFSSTPTLTGTNFTGIPESAVTGLVADLASKVNSSLLGVASGVATLDSTGKLTASQIPVSLLGAVVYQGTWNASTNSPALSSGTGTKGFYYKVATAGTTTIDGISQWNIGDTIIFDGTTWDKIDGIANEVVSVFGRSGPVVAATGDYTVAQITGAAPLASPALTGSPTAPTPATSDNSTLIATTAFVKAQAYPIKKTTTYGDGVSTSYTYVHGLNLSPINAAVVTLSDETLKDVIYADVVFVDANSVRVDYGANTIPTAAAPHRLTIIG